jgi:hypothetical protein
MCKFGPQLPATVWSQLSQTDQKSVLIQKVAAERGVYSFSQIVPTEDAVNTLAEVMSLPSTISEALKGSGEGVRASRLLDVKNVANRKVALLTSQGQTWLLIHSASECGVLSSRCRRVVKSRV